MSFPKYPKYKDTGVEWLGEVPEHWDVKGMRNIANVVRGASPRPAGDPRYFGGVSVPWVTVAEITKDDHVELRETESYLTDEGANQSKRFAQGTLIYSNSGATLGVPKILRIDACANDGVVAFEGMSSDVSPRFLYHFLASITEAIREKVKQGSGQPNLNTDIVKNLQFALPPPIEQQAIESFLYRETSKIDSLVGEQRRLIELLKEKRQAVITHAVTKGLNPNAPLKSSGIEWLGNVPEHWEIGTIKRFFTFLNGRRIPLSGEERAGRSGVFAYYGASGIIDWIDAFIFGEDLVLVSEDGANLLNRSTPIAFVARGKYWVNNHAHILKPLDTNRVFWAERIESIDLIPFVTGSAQPKLTAEALNNLMIAVPPTESERAEIEKYIGAETAKLDSLTDEAERGIDLLLERRTALISAAVTGKIDVRKLVESETV